MQAFRALYAYLVLRDEELRDDVVLAVERPEVARPEAGLEVDLASGPLERWLAVVVDFWLREAAVLSFLLLYSFITLKKFK